MCTLNVSIEKMESPVDRLDHHHHPIIMIIILDLDIILSMILPWLAPTTPLLPSERPNNRLILRRLLVAACVEIASDDDERVGGGPCRSASRRVEAGPGLVLGLCGAGG